MTLLEGSHSMARSGSKTVALPQGTVRREGMVLGTKALAARVDRAETLRARMYALIEAHPETAEELLARAEAAKPDPLPKLGATGAPTEPRKVSRDAPAAQYIAKDTVSHPRLEGYQEQVRRTVTTIEHMRRRKQLGRTPEENDLAYRAAERLRHAYETIYGGAVGGTMDFDRTRGVRSTASPGPTDSYLACAGYLNQAKSELYARHHFTVIAIAAKGCSLDEVAEHLFRRAASRQDKEYVGRCLRDGLSELAALWWGSTAPEAPTNNEPRIWRQPGARPTETQPGVIQRASTVHATGRRVFRSK